MKLLHGNPTGKFLPWLLGSWSRALASKLAISNVEVQLLLYTQQTSHCLLDSLHSQSTRPRGIQIEPVHCYRKKIFEGLEIQNVKIRTPLTQKLLPPLHGIAVLFSDCLGSGVGQLAVVPVRGS